ncbi:MAG: polymer-forming cytoskeletal protein, partial [Chlamydiales bacterium]
QAMAKEENPETTLGEGVSFRGELSFERLLRIDGTFEGNLLSEGKVVIGPKGKVKANLNLREAIIEGELDGNVTVQEKLELRGDAFIKGDICAKSICVDEGVRIIGYVCVDSDSPEESAPAS